MQTEQTNPAVVTIQDTIVELERLIELYNNFSPEKTASSLSEDQLQVLGKHVYREAFVNNSLGYLARYMATEMRDLIFAGPDNDTTERADQVRDEFCNRLASRIVNSSDFRYYMRDYVQTYYFNEHSPFMEEFLKVATTKLVEHLTKTSFTLTQAKTNNSN